MSGELIYVCDDELDLREMVSEYLCERGFSAKAYEGGAALLDGWRVFHGDGCFPRGPATFGRTPNCGFLGSPTGQTFQDACVSTVP